MAMSVRHTPLANLKACEDKGIYGMFLPNVKVTSVLCLDDCIVCHRLGLLPEPFSLRLNYVN